MKSMNPQVEVFLAQLDHPFKQEILEVRRIIHDANERLTEHIKWNAPSFCLHGEDRITFNLHGGRFYRLIFHCGAQKSDGSDKKPYIDDPDGLLEWAASDRAIMKLTDMADVNSKREKLALIVRQWLEATS